MAFSKQVLSHQGSSWYNSERKLGRGRHESRLRDVPTAGVEVQ